MKGAFYLFSAFYVLISCGQNSKQVSSETAVQAVEGKSWTTTGYGGGGAMFNPAVSPFNPKFAFVGCDMTGSYVTYDGGGSWRMFNLRKNVDFFVFDPSDSNTVYANSILLFKSSDRGKTWSAFYPAPAEIKGVIPKGDHAEESVLTVDSSVRKVLAFAVDPTNSSRLFAAISINKSDGFYVSEDGGKQWKKEKDLERGTSNVFIDPSSAKDNRTIYITGANNISVREKGQWRSNPGPEKVKLLTRCTGGLDKKINRFIIYAMAGKSYFNPTGDQSGIYYTENGGETWENRQNGLIILHKDSLNPPEFRAIAVSSGNPEVVYVSYNNLRASADTSYIGVARSTDYGRTWELSWKDIMTKSGNTPSANFKSGWINERFGPSWGENPFSIAVSPTNPDICYATDFGRTVTTFNGGRTWEQAYTNKKNGFGWISRGLEVTTGYMVAFDPFDAKHRFICNTDIGLMESTDKGGSWSSATVNNGVPRKWRNSAYWMTFDPKVKGKVWAVMSDVHDLPRPKMWRKNGVANYEGGILTSEDAGKTWQIISESAGEAAFTHILVDSSSNEQSRTLYACAFGKGVYKSVDGGKTWILKNKGLKGKEPFAWRITRREKDGVLFLVVCRRSDDGSIGNDLDGAIYRSDDGADSWKMVSLPPQTNGPMSLVVDPENPQRILFSSWGKKTPQHYMPDTGGGIFVSNDDGKTWQPTLQKDQFIHDITYDGRNKVFYACGFNGSAYRSEDKGNTWSRIKGYNFKWGKRVDPDPADPEKIFIMTYGGGLWYGPANGDEQATEDIVPALTRF